MEPEEHAHSSEVAVGTFWGLAGTAALKLVSFLYIIYIARAVSQGEVGTFYLALSIIGLFGAWKTLGLPSALVRYIPFYDSKGEFGKVRSLLKWTYAINIISGALFAAMVWLAADLAAQFYQNPGLAEVLRLLSVFIVLDNIFSINTSFLQGKGDILSMQIMGNAQNLSKLLLTLLFFTLYGPSVYTLTASFMLSYAVGVAFSAKPVYSMFLALPQGKSQPQDLPLVREIIPFGLTLTVVQGIWALVSYTDRILLGYFLPSPAAGNTLAIYSLAVALALNITVFPGAVGNIFLPMISKLVGRNDMDGVRKVMATAQRWMFFITIPFAIVMIAFSAEMLSVFYGSAYEPGKNAMALFTAGLLLSTLSYVVTLALAGMRLVGLELKVSLAVSLANLLLCLLLIPIYGMEGAALASAISFGLSSVIFFHYAKTRIGFTTPPGVYRLFAIGALVCVLLVFAKPWIGAAADALPPFQSQPFAPYLAKVEYLLLLGAVAAAAAAVFVAGSLFFKCFEHEDLAVMRKMAKKATFPERWISYAEGIMARGIEKK